MDKTDNYYFSLSDGSTVCANITEISFHSKQPVLLNVNLVVFATQTLFKINKLKKGVEM